MGLLSVHCLGETSRNGVFVLVTCVCVRLSHLQSVTFTVPQVVCFLAMPSSMIHFWRRSPFFDVPILPGMGWLRLVGSLKSYVSFAKEPYTRDYILQKRLVIWRSLLIEGTQLTNWLAQLTQEKVFQGTCTRTYTYTDNQFLSRARDCFYKMIVLTHDVGLHSTRYSIVYIQSLTFPSKEPGPKKNIRIYIYIFSTF